VAASVRRAEREEKKCQEEKPQGLKMGERKCLRPELETFRKCGADTAEKHLKNSVRCHLLSWLSSWQQAAVYYVGCIQRQLELALTGAL
jgi:hypothetical protein